MTTAELARAVADALEDESKWTTGSCAINAGGQPCDAAGSRAVQWCAMGRAISLDDYRNVCALCGAYRSKFGIEMMEDNDDSTRGRLFVQARLRELAESLEGKS